MCVLEKQGGVYKYQSNLPERQVQQEGNGGVEEEGVEGRHLATAGLNYPWRGWVVCETGGWWGG